MSWDDWNRGYSDTLKGDLTEQQLVDFFSELEDQVYPLDEWMLDGNYGSSDSASCTFVTTDDLLKLYINVNQTSDRETGKDDGFEVGFALIRYYTNTFKRRKEYSIFKFWKWFHSEWEDIEQHGSEYVLERRYRLNMSTREGQIGNRPANIAFSGEEFSPLIRALWGRGVYEFRASVCITNTINFLKEEKEKNAEG